MRTVFEAQSGFYSAIDRAMYIPHHFEQQDATKVFDFIHQHSFVTLISGHNDAPSISHVPVLIEHGEPLKVLGHLAYANPHWRHIQAQPRVLLKSLVFLHAGIKTPVSRPGITPPFICMAGPPFCSHLGKFEILSIA